MQRKYRPVVVTLDQKLSFGPGHLFCSLVFSVSCGFSMHLPLPLLESSFSSTSFRKGYFAHLPPLPFGAPRQAAPFCWTSCCETRRKQICTTLVPVLAPRHPSQRRQVDLWSSVFLQDTPKCPFLQLTNLSQLKPTTHPRPGG